MFKEIGAKYGPFDMCAIPVGAYEPRWFHRPSHLDPEEAVQVYQDVGGKAAIAVHCCTWSLTDEPLDEPPVRLAAAAAAAGLQPGAFAALKHGETRIVPAEEAAVEAAPETKAAASA